MIEQKQNEGLFTALAMPIKKNPTTSIRKYANELKVHEKTVRTAIKQDLSQNLLDYVIWDVLKNEINATSHPNMSSLKIVTSDE